MNEIKIGIVGYGNLGRGLESVLKYSSDMKLIAVFTRRDPSEIQLQNNAAKVVHIDKILDYKDKIDVMLLCGGSATDLPKQGPDISEFFNTVDSFDTHAKILEYIDDIKYKNNNVGKVSIVSVGWDPGLFSILRILGEAIIPNGNSYTFWGKGVSQGHSDAIRRINGVKDAIEYTIPLESAIQSVRNRENPTLSIKEKHIRECFVVLENSFDSERIEYEIKNMPNYFSDYTTVVHFISEEELYKNHNKLTHGGRVMRTGNTEGTNGINNHIFEGSLVLDSNPEFTASVLVAYARAAYRLSQEGNYGVKTVFDIPLKYLINLEENKLIKNLL